MSTHPGCLDAGIASSVTATTTAVRLKGGWSLLPLSGQAAGTSTDDGSRPLVPPVGITTAAAGLLFLGGVLADGVEDLAVSYKPITAIISG